MTTPTDDPIITRRQVRAFLGGVARSTLWRWEAEGKLPPVIRISPRVQGWRKSSLEKLLADRQVGVQA